MTTKTITEWEKIKNVIILDTDTSLNMTEEEFDDISIDRKIGVAHEDRKIWLKNNGYKVNRENMINVNLKRSVE